LCVAIGCSYGLRSVHTSHPLPEQIARLGFSQAGFLCMWLCVGYVLLGFRTHIYAFTADISSMYNKYSEAPEVVTSPF